MQHVDRAATLESRPRVACIEWIDPLMGWQLDAGTGGDGGESICLARLETFALDDVGRYGSGP